MGLDALEFLDGRSRWIFFLFPGDDELAQFHGDDVGQDAKRDSGDHGGADENDRHQRRHPEGIGLDRAEDETGVAVQEAGDGDTDTGQAADSPLIGFQGMLADVPGTKGQDGIQSAVKRFDGGLVGLGAQLQRRLDEVFPVDEP